MATRIDVHLQSGDVSVYWLWLLLDVSAVSIVIVILVICDMPKQEFSLSERVDIHNTHIKSRKSCSETRCKFRVKFPGWHVPNPSTIRGQAKRFKETGSVKNRSQPSMSCSYRWDWQEIRTYPPKISKTFVTGNWSICVVCTKSNKITVITYMYCEYTHVHTMRIPV